MDSSASGNRKRGLLLQRELLKIIIERWKCWKSSTVRRLKDWHIGMDTDDQWWVMVKVGAGEEREVKVRDASAILTGRCSCTVIC